MSNPVFYDKQGSERGGGGKGFHIINMSHISSASKIVSILLAGLLKGEFPSAIFPFASWTDAIGDHAHLVPQNCTILKTTRAIPSACGVHVIRPAITLVIGHVTRFQAKTLDRKYFPTMLSE